MNSSKDLDGVVSPLIFYETNLARLRPAKLLQEELAEHTVSKVKIVRGPRQVPNMVISGVPVYDTDTPLAIVKQQVDALESEDQVTIAVLFGLGLGYHAEALERRYNCPIIVFDPSLDAIQTALENRPLPLLRTHLAHTLTHLTGEVQPRLQFSDRKIVVAAIPAYTQLFPVEFADFRRVLEEAIVNSRIMEDTIKIRTNTWVEHLEENVPLSVKRQSIDCLEQRFEGKPGIIVAAGPSLDKNIHLLADYQDNAVICAINGTVRPLDKAGVIPHFVAVVESLDLSKQIVEVDWLKKTCLLPALISNPKFHKIPARHIFPTTDQSASSGDWFHRAWNWTRQMTGGSVACTAFSVLRSLGCDPIILIGQDLAYTDGARYSKAATFGQQTMRVDEKTGRLVAVDRNDELEKIRLDGGLDLEIDLRAEEVEAWGGGGGGGVYTTKMFSLFRTWFESAARLNPRGNLLINATEGGARIAGFEEMRLEIALQKYCGKPFHPLKLIDEAAASASPNNLQALRLVLLEDIEIIRGVIERSQEAISLASTSIDIIETKGYEYSSVQLERLSRTEKELGRISKQNMLLDSFVAAEIHELRIRRNEDENMDQKTQTLNSLARSIKLFEAIRQGSAKLSKRLETLLERISE